MSLDDQRAEIEFRGVEIKAEDSTLWQQGKAGVIGVNKKKKNLQEKVKTQVLTRALRN